MDKTLHYEAILFDMDGVLIDSEELMARSGVLGLKDFGIDAKPEDFIPFVGRGEDMYMGGVARKYGHEFDPEMKTRCYYHYGLHVEEEAFVPREVSIVLPALKEAGLKLAVCTSADMGKVVHNLRAIGVGKDFFDGFVTGDSITRLKPDPEIYLTGARLTGTAPEKCLVVEDAPSGILSAHAAGMKVAAITSTFDEKTLREQAGPDFFIHNLLELLDLVGIN